jgi:3'-phosphoadenosine 5'-phosphosulfate (PAPS) 3'-phosphatase
MQASPPTAGLSIPLNKCRLLLDLVNTEQRAAGLLSCWVFFLLFVALQTALLQQLHSSIYSKETATQQQQEQEQQQEQQQGQQQGQGQQEQKQEQQQGRESMVYGDESLLKAVSLVRGQNSLRLALCCEHLSLVLKV